MPMGSTTPRKRSAAAAADVPVHIVIRYAGALLGIDETIAAHQSTIRQEGAVLFGKMGRPLGAPLVSQLNRQADAGTATHLFLVARDRQDLIVNRGLIRSVAQEISNDARVPRYYRELGIASRMATWFELTELEPARPDVLKKLAVVSTGNPISAVVGSSRSSMFVARLMSGRRLD